MFRQLRPPTADGGKATRPRPVAGFALVELAVVLVLLSVIAGLSVPTFGTLLDRADLAAAQATAESVVREATVLSVLDGQMYPLTEPDVAVAAADIGVTAEGFSFTVTGSRATYACTVSTDAVSASVGCVSGGDGPGPLLAAPAAPTAVTVSALSSTSLSVAFTAGADNGAAISSFAAVCDSTDGGVSGSGAGDSSPIVVSSLSAGATYTCTVSATNSEGTSAASAASTSTVMPVPLALAYTTTQFTSGSDNQQLTASTVGGSGTKTYSITGGQLPDGVTFDEATGTFTGPAASAWNFQAVQVSAGNSFTCALTTNGGVKCWGWNFVGQLGDGTTTNRLTPVDVVGLTSGVASIDAGNVHACAVLTNGGVKCWGNNDNGQLGDGTVTQRLTPVDVVGLTSGAASIDAGSAHTCAVTTGGGVKCWGANSGGQLGDGTTTARRTPVDVVGLTSGVASVTAGGNGGLHSCAVTVSGGAKCWGSNGSGRLGDGTTTNRLTPVDVVGLTSGVAAISAGTSHTCAVTTSGGAKCWGSTSAGRVGDGTTLAQSRTSPVDVVGLTSGVAAISAGATHSCAVTTSGGAKCWGHGGFGKLGNGSTTNRGTPVDVTGLTSGASTISAENVHTCSLTSTGGVKCWGANTYGGLGDGTTTQRLTPVDTNFGAGFGPQPGFPAELTVTVTDESGSTSVQVTLTRQ